MRNKIIKFIAAVVGIYAVVFFITLISIIIRDAIKGDYPVYLDKE